MLESPPTTPSGRAERSVPRLAAVALLLVAAGIHVYEYFGQDIAYLAVLFLVSAFGLLVGAGLLLARAPRLGWLIGGLSALLTFIAYAYSRGIGLPADSSDIGNWLQPDGVASLVVELLVFAGAVWALTGRYRVTVDHAREEIKATVPGLPIPESPCSAQSPSRASEII